MNRALLVGLLLLPPVTASAADDLYKRPRKAPVSAAAYDWTGVYFGVHVDMAQQSTTIQSNVQQTTDSYDAGSPYGSLSLNGRGVLGGVHLGYNQQFGMTVVGFEADASLGNVKTSKTFDAPGVQQIEAKYASADTSYTSLRGRFGFAIDNLLIYGTVGGAFRNNETSRTQYATTAPQYATNTQAEAADYSTVPIFVESAKKSQSGLAFGGGVELASSLGWSISASYIVTKWNKTAFQTPRALDSVYEYPTVPVANGRTNNIDATTQTFRLGLNYKL